MGSPEDEEYRSDDEQAVNVTLSEGFWMAQTACTQAQWKALMGTTPTELKNSSPLGKGRGRLDLEGPDLPMHFLSPEDVREFCSRLATEIPLRSGWILGLPTEAQWEYACRAGTSTAYHVGDEITERHANIDAFSKKDIAHLSKVASYPPNAWGLYDMHGNVSQLCADWYGELLSGGTDPIGPSSGTDYVSRGGAWTSSSMGTRSAHREHFVEPGARVSGIGFRLVLAPLPSSTSQPIPLSVAHPHPMPSPLTVESPELSAFKEVLDSLSETDAHRANTQRALDCEKEAIALKAKGEHRMAAERYIMVLGNLEDAWQVNIPPAIAMRIQLSRCLLDMEESNAAIQELKLALALHDASFSKEDRGQKWMPLQLLVRMNKTHLLDSELTSILCFQLAAAIAEKAQKESSPAEKALLLQEAKVFADRCLHGRKQSLQPDSNKILAARQLVTALTVGMNELPLATRPSPPTWENKLPVITELPESAKSRVKTSSRRELAEADQQRRQACTLYYEDQFTEARPLLAAATDAYKRILGAEHPFTLKCRGVNAWIQSTYRTEKETAQELRTIIAIQQRVLPKDDPVTVWCREKLLQIIQREHAPKEALGLAQSILEQHTRNSGPDDQKTLSAHEAVAKLMESCTLDAGAEKEYAKLTSLTSRKQGVASDRAINSRKKLGHLLLQHGQPAASLPHLLSVQVFSDRSDDTNTLNLAYALALLNRPSEALVFVARVATPEKKDGNSIPTPFQSEEQVPPGAEALQKALITRLENINKVRQGHLNQEADISSEETSSFDSTWEKIHKIGLGNVMYGALRGDGECQFFTSTIYGNGVGVEKNPVATYHWARLSAEAGNLDGQNRVAWCYSNGEGVSKDMDEANRLYQQSADSGSAIAMYNLGMSYMLGTGFKKDPDRMIYWYEKSAVAGFLPAQLLLGSIFHIGSDGVGQDMQTSCKWFAMGAEQDDADCLYHLGNRYIRGEGVPRSEAKAVELWRRAAEQGNQNAQFKLGCTYYASDGAVAKDHQLAYIWLKLAAAQGHKQAAQFASDLATYNLSKKQITEATSRIKQFTPRKPRPGTVSFESSTRKKPAPATGDSIATGTGFFISRAGHLVTNYHVIKETSGIRVLLEGDNEAPAVLVAQDKKSDLAILKITLPDNKGAIIRNHLPVTPTGGVKLGSTVATVGFPNIAIQGFSPKLTKGEISSLAGLQDDPGQFQISVPLQPGNSGGALVDSKGNVVGVVCSILDQSVALATTGTLATNVGYAVKSSLLFNLIESVPGLSEQLAPPATEVLPFEDVVEGVQQATVMILVKGKAATQTKPTRKN